MIGNMCASCRILHNPIGYLEICGDGGTPSSLSGFASTRVYVHETADGWILLRSYLGFCYIHTGSYESICDTSITEVVDILRRNSPYYVA
jgi:hypothetical protein